MNRSCRICQQNVSMSDAEAFALILLDTTPGFLSIFATAEQDLVSSDDVAAVDSDEKM